MEWQERAKCKDLSIGESDKLFFLGRGGSPNKAVAFCAKCPVQNECRNESILYDEQGIWAGLTDEQRKAIAPTLKPLLQEEARREGRLKEFYQPNAHPEIYSDSTRCLCCGANHGGTCPNTLPQSHNWLQNDDHIDDNLSREIEPDSQHRELPNQPHDALRLAG